MYGVVYQITNKVNGKSYVGQSINPSHRKAMHFRGNDYQTSSILRKAMCKYGRENFDFRVIAVAESKEDLDCKEIDCIKELGTLIPNGYNIREGGSRGRLAESSKQKISKANKGRLAGKKNPCYGRVGAKSPLYGKVGPNKGKIMSEDQKQLLSTSMTGLKRSEENKKNSSLAAKKRWAKDRENHLSEKGHKYDLVRLANGSIRCRICKNENSRRKYREMQRVEARKKKAKARRR